MNPNSIIEESVELLDRTLQESSIHVMGANYREAFVHRHCLYILQLGCEALHLLQNGMSSSSAIIVRSMLESLFKLVAATKNDTNAAEILVYEIKDEIRRIGKIGTELAVDKNVYSTTVEELSDLVNHITAVTPGLCNRNWNALECAKAAELKENYYNEYFIFSKKVHATSSGIVSAHAELGLGHTLHTIAYVFLAAVAHLAQVVVVKNPQATIDRATALLSEIIAGIEAGEFDRLDS